MVSIPDKDVWFITGCSSGLGAALAKHVSGAGCPVVATARKPETLSYLADGPNVLKLALDVTKQDQVAQAIQAATDHFGRLDVVVNNAGYGVMCDTEVLPDADARAQLETNFWGVVNVTRAALPIFREVNPPGKGGLFMQISSVGGRVCYAGAAFYSASKFALEGWTDSVAKEMHPDWNIKFTIIELGAVLTNFVGNMHLPPRHPAYADPGCGYNMVRAYMADQASTTQWNDAAVCARVLHELASCRNERPPPLRLALGADSWTLVRAELEDIMKEHEAWKTVAESTSHAENAQATEVLMAFR